MDAPSLPWACLAHLCAVVCNFAAICHKLTKPHHALANERELSHKSLVADLMEG